MKPKITLHAVIMVSLVTAYLMEHKLKKENEMLVVLIKEGSSKTNLILADEGDI